MPAPDVRSIVETWTSDESLIDGFLSVWRLLEEILEAFSRATWRPIFVFMRGSKLFQSSLQGMPGFCQLMLSCKDTYKSCVADGLRRAELQEPEIEPGLQMCHAGMLNGRKEVEVGHLGAMVILFGAQKSTNSVAENRRRTLIAGQVKDVAVALASASEADESHATLDHKEMELINAIGAIAQHLFSVTLGIHWHSINMAHELANMMLPSGLAALELKEQASVLISVQDHEHQRSVVDGIVQTAESLQVDSRLGLYIVRNYLSHVSESRYREAVPQKMSIVDLRALVINLISLYRSVAAQKGVTIKIDSDVVIPRVRGLEQELQRAVHNILNNAIKYSYHSTVGQARDIRIWSKVPYDPGFRSKRFALTFENYGLGLLPEEVSQVFKAGFRGQQAIAEVPIGSGIGLSEVRKIMRAHGGDVKFRCREVHRGEGGVPTFLTQVDLIFSYNQGLAGVV